MKRMIKSSDQYSNQPWKDPELEYVSNVNGYQVYRKIENGKGKWFAHYQDDPIETMFPITYDQARGFEDMPARSSIEQLSRDLGRDLLPVRSSSGYDRNKYPEYTTTKVGGQRFSVHYAPFARGIYASISEIHPYDDAEYAWAKIDNSIVYFYKDGKLLDKMHLADYDEDMDGDYDVWWKDTIDSVAEVLNDMNKDVKPIMVHN